MYFSLSLTIARNTQCNSHSHNTSLEDNCCNKLPFEIPLLASTPKRHSNTEARRGKFSYAFCVHATCWHVLLCSQYSHNRVQTQIQGTEYRVALESLSCFLSLYISLLRPQRICSLTPAHAGRRNTPHHQTTPKLKPHSCRA